VPLSTRSWLDDRCARGDGTVKRYPSQWEEAEADFWGATALGLWLETEKNLMLRKKKANDLVARLCLEKGHELGRDPEEESRRSRKAPDPSKCEEMPASGYELPDLKTSEEEPHQHQRVRLNRNYLRNSDLRRALGCPITDADVAVECSPLTGEIIRHPW
jgi:hypothetical protein